MTMLTKLHTYLPYFPPDQPGQLVTSLPDDDIKKILYHTMPNTWENKMVEQGYNYFNGVIHSMAEIFKTGIENLEKSIPPSVPSRNKEISKKGSKKSKAVTFGDSKDEDSEEEYKGKEFCHYHGTCGHTMDECTTLNSLVKQATQNKKENISRKRKCTPNMRLTLWFRSKLKKH